MTKIHFNVTVTIPDEKVDADGKMIGSEEWRPSASIKNSDHQLTQSRGLPPWEAGREPAAHYAARVLICYANSTIGVGVKTTIRKGR